MGYIKDHYDVYKCQICHRKLFHNTSYYDYKIHNVLCFSSIYKHFYNKDVSSDEKIGKLTYMESKTPLIIKILKFNDKNLKCLNVF
jgi:hypothetical protein